jgi:hypothetical protein
MARWRVNYAANGWRIHSHTIVEAMTAEEAESIVLRRFFGNDTFSGIVSVERV